MEDKVLKMEKEQALAQLMCLKSQVNPHFLFNSLSILSSLVRTDPALSEKFIDQMSRTYRYILDQRDQALVSLRQEIDFVRSFSFALRIRFANKFDLRIDIEDEKLDLFKIPPLTLQLLIENAIAHNRMSQLHPLTVQIGLEADVLVITNELQPRPSAGKAEGQGLQSIVNRFALLTDRPIWAGETEDYFVVKLPLLF
jgi:LytS/YehU family sensor histidine kinase